MRFVTLLLLPLTWLLAGACTSEPASSTDASGLAARVWFSDKPRALHLSLDPSAMAALAREPRDYVRGSVRFADQTLAEIGVRFKGHRSLRQWSSKPAFKLRFDKYDGAARLGGLTEISLNNMVEDPTLLRERIAYQVFRTLGAPAPRVGYVEVFVNGKLFGLYLAVESTSGPFFAQAFADKKPLVYEGEYGCDVYPEDIWGLELDQGKDPGRAQIGALAAAAGGPIMRAIEGPTAVLDGARLFAFLAASAWVADFDGYRHAHNYRLFQERSTGRWSLVPWGLDRALYRDQDPFDSHGRLARRCFSDAACRLEYVKTLSAALDKLAGPQLVEELDSVAARIEAAAQRDGRKPHGSRTRKTRRAELRTFLEERSARLRPSVACWNGQREVDADGDGYGCMDCDDQDPSVHPGAEERCDGVDRDCSGQPDDAQACDCAVVVAGGATFELCDRRVDWPTAAATCEARGLAMAFFDSAEQARAVNQAAEALREADWWIGLNDREEEGVHRYRGSDSSFRYWATREPDDYACGEHCAAFKEDAHGRFRDLHCHSQLPFVCRHR